MHLLTNFNMLGGTACNVYGRILGETQQNTLDSRKI